MKVQFWIEDSLLPYLVKEVPHTIVDKQPGALRVEINANGLILSNLVFAAQEYGATKAFDGLTKKTIAA